MRDNCNYRCLSRHQARGEQRADQPVSGMATAGVYAPTIVGKMLALVIWGSGLGASDAPDNNSPNL